MHYHFWEIFKGESDTLSRTANLLHTLGTISVSDVWGVEVGVFVGRGCRETGVFNPPTLVKGWLPLSSILQVLCCVNKDGILASPNPNAEKVFFFRKRKERRHKKVQLRTSQLASDEDRANFFAANIVDDEDESSTTSPVVHTDIHLREPLGEEEMEHSGIPTPQLNQRGRSCRLGTDFVPHFVYIYKLLKTAHLVLKCNIFKFHFINGYSFISGENICL